MNGKFEQVTEETGCKTHLHQILSLANIGMWSYDPKTQIPTWSENMFIIFGRSPNNSPPSYEEHKKYIHPDDWTIFDRAVNNAVNNGVGYKLKLRVVRPDETLRWIITKCEAIMDASGDVERLIGTVIDVTDEQKLENELETSEFKFKNIFDNAINGILIANNNAEYVYANQAICDMTGYSHDELLSMTLMDITPLPENVNGKELFQEFIKQGKQTGEYQIKKKDGTMITAEYRAVANIAPGLHVSIIDDITEKKKNDEERNKLDKKLKLAMKSANEGLWEWNLKTNEVFFDNVSLQMLGYSPDGLTDLMKKGSWWIEQVHPDDKKEMKTKFNKYINGETNEYSVEFRLKNKDDGYTWISSTGSIIEHDREGKPVVVSGVVQDITKRKRIEEQLKSSEEKFKALFE